MASLIRSACRSAAPVLWGALSSQVLRRQIPTVALHLRLYATAKPDNTILTNLAPEDASVASAKPKGVATEAINALFKGSEVVPDSALDGFYCMNNMKEFENWISTHTSTLTNKDLVHEKSKSKILVLDLDNTLITGDIWPADFCVDTENGRYWHITVHPDCLRFLHEMEAHHLFIAIYTSSSRIYAEKVTEQLRQRYLKAYPDACFPIIMTRSRNHCVPSNGENKKDLLQFGSLDDVVFVDDDPYYSMKNQNNNIVQVRRYKNSSDEAGLMAIAPLLTFLSSVKSVSSSMAKLKKAWFNKGLVKIVPSTKDVTC